MIRTQVLQEVRRMRFKEAYGGWQERWLSQVDLPRFRRRLMAFAWCVVIGESESRQG